MSTPLTIQAANLTPLLTSLATLADTFLGFDPVDGNTFTGLTCTEANALATTLALAGHDQAAAHVLRLHGMGDEHVEIDTTDEHEYIGYHNDPDGADPSEGNPIHRRALEYVDRLAADARMG